MDAQPAQSAAGFRKRLVRKLLVDLAIMTVIGVFLALIGPLGSISDPLAVRLVVWLGLAYAGYFIYSPVGWLVERMHRAYDLPRLGLWIAGTMLATVPMAIIIWSLNQLNVPGYRVPAADEALVHYGYVLVIGGGITLLFNVIGSNRPQAAQAAQPAQTPAEEAPPKPTHPRLVERLPAALGSDIIALEMEDHYVRVHTALGSEMILMRLRDAIAELDGIEGRKVHRSWWVARGAVEEVLRDGRNVRLKLARGIETPVSRAQVSELRNAGWF